MEKKESLTIWMMIIIAIVAVVAIVGIVVLITNSKKVNDALTGYATGGGTSGGCLIGCYDLISDYSCQYGPAQGNKDSCRAMFAQCITCCYDPKNSVCPKPGLS